MSDQKRRFWEGSLRAPHKPSVSPTFIGGGSVIVGNIRGCGEFIVSGEIEGDGDLHGGLNLLVTGCWTGNVRARQAIIAGRITGSLIIADQLEIGYTAVIHGKVTARTIAIARGAIVDGEIEITSSVPILRFDEKREGTASSLPDRDPVTSPAPESRQT